MGKVSTNMLQTEVSRLIMLNEIETYYDEIYQMALAHIMVVNVMSMDDYEAQIEDKMKKMQETLGLFEEMKNGLQERPKPLPEKEE